MNLAYIKRQNFYWLKRDFVFCFEKIISNKRIMLAYVVTSAIIFNKYTMNVERGQSNGI